MINVDGKNFVFDQSAEVPADQQESVARTLMRAGQKLNIQWEKPGT